MTEPKLPNVLKKKALGIGSVDGEIIKILEGQSIKGTHQGAEVDLIKVDQQGKAQILGVEPAAKSDLQTAQGDISALQTDLGVAQSDITTLQGHVQTAEGDISTLKGEMTTAQGDITNLEGRVLTAEGDITNLKGRVSTAEGDISTLKGEMTTAQGDITNLEGRVLTAEGDISDLQTNVLTAQGDISTLQTDVNGLRQDVVDANDAIGVLQTDVGQLQTDVAAKISSSEKGAAHGVAPLDANSKIADQYLPASIVGALKYKGSIDASLGAYPASPAQGDYWVVSVEGTISGHLFHAGDWMVYNGASWDDIDNSQKVSSVNSQIGAVVLDSDDIAEGVNHLYYTDARAEAAAPVQSVNAKVGAIVLNSGDIAEGSNLYFTAQRASDASPVQSVNAKVGAIVLGSDDIAEGSSHLYFTAQRASDASPVQSVAGKSGAVVLAKADVGLGNVDNTSDASKPISTAVQTALDLKQNSLGTGTTAQYLRGDLQWANLSSIKAAKVYTVGVEASTIAGCIALCSSPSATNNYIIEIPPGTYTEDLTIPGNVHLKGLASPGDTLSVKIIGQHTITGTSNNALNNRVVIANILFTSSHATTPILTVSGTLAATQVQVSGSFFNQTASASTAKSISIGAFGSVYLNATLMRGSGSGAGGTHVVLSAAGATLYSQFGLDIDGGSCAIDVQAAGYVQIIGGIISTQGSQVIKIAANATVGIASSTITNNATVGHGINMVGAGASFLVSHTTFNILNDASSYAVTGVAGTYYAFFSINYGNLAALGVIRNTKIGSNVTQARYSGSLASADISDFVASAKSAAVANSITSGVTDVAPSQGAVYTALSNKLALAGGTMTGNLVMSNAATIAMGGAKITGVGTPSSNSTDAANTAYVDAAVGTRIASSEKGANNGVATLDSSGKLTSSQVPAIAITSTFVVSSQALMLALSAQEGDVAIRTDLNKSFILSSSSPSTLADWKELLTPTDLVQSVNGKNGTVVLSTSDIAEGTNLYWTSARFSSSFSSAFPGAFATGMSSVTTSNLAEGANLYFTNARAVSALSSTLADYFKKDGSVVASGAFDMNSHKISNLTSGSLAGDAVNKGQLDAKVENQVVQGVTDKAPSQAAVYSAIAAVNSSMLSSRKESFDTGVNPAYASSVTLAHVAEANSVLVWVGASIVHEGYGWSIATVNNASVITFDAGIVDSTPPGEIIFVSYRA